jgi:hypothetical protein
MPPRQYFGPWRAFPDSCEQFGWQEMRPVGFDRRYFGVDVFEGAYRYQGVRITPNNGGSAFEALMVPLFVPEEAWGAGSWRVNHPLGVQAHIHHGLVEAGYGYWGFSPADVPEGGYRAWGVDALGTAANGYPSNEDNTFVDYGHAGRVDAVSGISLEALRLNADNERSGRNPSIRPAQFLVSVPSALRRTEAKSAPVSMRVPAAARYRCSALSAAGALLRCRVKPTLFPWRWR